MQFYEKYKPLLELNNSKYGVIVLTGGRGSEKTGHVLRGILVCSAQKKKKTCFFRETKETLSDSLKAELDGIIEAEFPNRGFATTKEDVRHANGSYMFFKGLREVNLRAVENLKGIATTTDFFVVDEAQAVSKATWDVLIPTLRKAGCVLIVIYNRIDDFLPVEDALFLDYDNMSAPKNTYFIEVNYPELEHLGHLSKEFLERAELIKKHKPAEYDTLYLNRPNRANVNYVVKYFTNDNIKSINYCNDMDLHIACDFNVDPMCWVLLHKTDDKLFYFDEIVAENTTTRECATEFCNRYPHHKGVIIINGDASGKNRSTQSEYHNYTIIKNTLQDFGYRKIEFNLRQWNPSIKSRILAFNNKIMTNRGERCIFIDPKCKWLLYNVKNLKYKENTSIVDVPTYSQMASNKDLKFLEHPFDAASYPAEYYYPVVMDYIKEPEKPLTVLEQWEQAKK